ncbi:MAG: LytR C-terminal domain-containing protein [bacterium]
MRQKRKIIEKREPLEIGPRIIAKTVGIGLVLILLISSCLQEYRKSIIVGSGIRSNLVMAEPTGEVAVVSFDPSEKRITELTLEDVAIKSRSIGEYKLSQLYRLGSYDGSGGEFVRRKMQGFLRLPLVDYIVVDDMGPNGLRKALLLQIVFANRASMSRIDALTLWFSSWSMMWRNVPFDTLIKDGVFVKNTEGFEVSNSRLQQFVGLRLFDWTVGGEGVTVAIINETEIEGLGNDIAKFLTNVGMDVVSVRSGDGQQSDKTSVLFSHKPKDMLATDRVLHFIFGRKEIFQYEQNLSEYRSDVVIKIGKDVMEMF